MTSVRPQRRAILRRVLPSPVVRVLLAARRSWRDLNERLFPTPGPNAFPLALPTPPTGAVRAARLRALSWLPKRALTAVCVDVPPSLYVGGVLRRSGLRGYEPGAISCFLALLDTTRCRLAFDVGANLGLYTLVGTALTRARIVAFEPEPTVAGALAWTTRLNGLAADAEAVAVGDHNGVATLYISDTTDASNSLNPAFRDAVGTVDVPLVTLDAYCQRTRRWPGLLKIDTETTEPAVLRGASQVLGRRPIILCEVLPGGAGAEIEAILRPLGYHWFQIEETLPPRAQDGIVGHESMEATNWVFLPTAPPPGLWENALEWRRRIEEIPAWR